MHSLHSLGQVLQRFYGCAVVFRSRFVVTGDAVQIFAAGLFIITVVINPVGRVHRGRNAVFFSIFPVEVLGRAFNDGCRFFRCVDDLFFNFFVIFFFRLRSLLIFGYAVHGRLIGVFLRLHFGVMSGFGRFGFRLARHRLLRHFHAFVDLVAVLFLKFRDRASRIADNRVEFADLVGDIANSFQVLRTVFHDTHRTGNIGGVKSRQPGFRPRGNKQNGTRAQNARTNALNIYHTTLRLGLCHFNNSKKKLFYKSILRFSGKI